MKLSKNNLELCGMTMLMIVELYKNQKQNIEIPINNMYRKINRFYGNVDSTLLKQRTNDFTKVSMEYILVTSTITNLFHTFEQYIKIEYEINTKGMNSFMDCLKNKCIDYDYNTEENTYYDMVEKYRILNNSIKHGKIQYTLKKDYPDYINTNDILGTLLDNSLNITEKDIDECFESLYGFIIEMYTYFEDMGYIESEM